MHSTTFLAFLAAISPSLALTGRPLSGSGQYFKQQRSALPLTGPAADYATDVKHFACGTNITHATPHFLNTIQHLNEADQAGFTARSPAAAAGLAARSSTTISVPLYMHIVTTEANAKMVTAAQATAQFKELNSAYAPFGVQFVLKNTTWTVNSAWAIDATTDDDTTMKTALRQGTYDALNLYFQSDLSGGLLGRCTLPTSVGTKPAPSVYVADGCNIALGTMPNRAHSWL